MKAVPFLVVVAMAEVRIAIVLKVKTWILTRVLAYNASGTGSIPAAATTQIIPSGVSR